MSWPSLSPPGAHKISYRDGSGFPVAAMATAWRWKSWARPPLSETSSNTTFGFACAVTYDIFAVQFDNDWASLLLAQITFDLDCTEFPGSCVVDLDQIAFDLFKIKFRRCDDEPFVTLVRLNVFHLQIWVCEPEPKNRQRNLGTRKGSGREERASFRRAKAVSFCVDTSSP